MEKRWHFIKTEGLGKNFPVKEGQRSGAGMASTMVPIVDTEARRARLSLGRAILQKTAWSSVV